MTYIVTDYEHLPSVHELGWAEYWGKEDTLVSLRMFGRYPIKVQDFWVPAMLAFGDALVATGYEDPTDYVGSFMVRPIFINGRYWSWHSYGGAVDWDYGGDTDGDGDPEIDKNPHLHDRIVPGDPRFGVEFQFTEADINAIEAIRTVNGKQVWRWLGWSIGDTMHFEPACSPDDIKTGIATEEDDMTYESFRAAEFDLWTDDNIMDAWDRGRFEDTNRQGFLAYWTSMVYTDANGDVKTGTRSERTDAEKARFMTDYYARL